MTANHRVTQPTDPAAIGQKGSVSAERDDGPAYQALQYVPDRELKYSPRTGPKEVNATG